MQQSTKEREPWNYGIPSFQIQNPKILESHNQAILRIADTRLFGAYRSLHEEAAIHSTKVGLAVKKGMNKGKTVEEKVLEALEIAGKPLTYVNLVDATGKNNSSVRKASTALLFLGKVRKLKKNFWNDSPIKVIAVELIK